MSSKQQHGISLLELMLSLAIIAILLLMATRYYNTTRMSQQVDEAAEMVTAIYTAGNAWLESHATFDQPDMLQAFVNDGSVPANFKAANINPWGAGLTVKANGVSTLILTMAAVPATACQNLREKVAQKMQGTVVNTSCLPEQSNPQTFAVTFNLGQ